MNWFQLSKIKCLGWTIHVKLSASLLPKLILHVPLTHFERAISFDFYIVARSLIARPVPYLDSAVTLYNYACCELVLTVYFTDQLILILVFEVTYRDHLNITELHVFSHWNSCSLLNHSDRILQLLGQRYLLVEDVRYRKPKSTFSLF